MALCEKAVQKRIKKWLDSEGHIVVKYPAGNPRLGAEVGVPDLLGVHYPSGRMLALEVKKEEGGVVSKKQVWFLDRFLAAGACAGVVRSIQDVKDLLEDHGLS